MPPDSTLVLRKEELSRRVDALPQEVSSWKARAKTQVDLDVHVSQLNAISVMLETLVEDQRRLLNGLDPAGAAPAFQDTGLELVKAIIRTQAIWNFFRDKLDLRFSPDFKDMLWVADTIAWD